MDFDINTIYNTYIKLYPYWNSFQMKENYSYSLVYNKLKMSKMNFKKRIIQKEEIIEKLSKIILDISINEPMLMSIIINNQKKLIIEAKRNS